MWEIFGERLVQKDLRWDNDLCFVDCAPINTEAFAPIIRAIIVQLPHRLNSRGQSIQAKCRKF